MRRARRSGTAEARTAKQKTKPVGANQNYLQRALPALSVSASAILWGFHVPFWYVAGALGLVVSGALFLSKRSARPTVVGIDVGHSAIKVVEIDRSANPKILHYGVTPTPTGSVAEGLVRDPELLVAALEKAMTDAGITQNEVVTVMTGQTLVVQHLDFPQMRDAELKNAIADQITQHVPLPADEILYDFKRIPSTREDVARLLLVATQREPVMQLVGTMRDAGLMPTRVDIEPIAAYRAVFGDEPSAKVVQPKRTRGRAQAPAPAAVVPPSADSGAESVVAEAKPLPKIRIIIDLGAGTSNVSIYQDGVLQLQRVLRVAGDDFTKAIAMSLKVQMDEAEALKREHGLTADSQIAFAVAPIADSLFREIRLSLEFFQSRNREVRFEDVILIGGNAKIKELPEQLQDNLTSILEGIMDVSALRVRMAANEKYTGAAGSPEEAAFPVIAVALGLALGEVSSVGSR